MNSLMFWLELKVIHKVTFFNSLVVSHSLQRTIRVLVIFFYECHNISPWDHLSTNDDMSGYEVRLLY